MPISRADRELLIGEVQIRPAIWNDADPNHKNMDVVEKNWKEIAQLMNKEVAAVKSKWKNLRAKMRKELLAMPQTKSGSPVPGWKSAWEYFDLMYFIKNVILPAPTTGNLEDDTDDNDFPDSESYAEENCQEGSTESPVPTPPVSSLTARCSSSIVSQAPSKRKVSHYDTSRLELEKKKIQILENSSALDRQLIENACNADYYFLISLLPFIEPLTLIEKMDLREKLQNEVNKAYKKHCHSQISD